MAHQGKLSITLVVDQSNASQNLLTEVFDNLERDDFVITRVIAVTDGAVLSVPLDLAVLEALQNCVFVDFPITRTCAPLLYGFVAGLNAANTRPSGIVSDLQGYVQKFPFVASMGGYKPPAIQGATGNIWVLTGTNADGRPQIIQSDSLPQLRVLTKAADVREILPAPRPGHGAVSGSGGGANPLLGLLQQFTNNL